MRHKYRKYFRLLVACTAFAAITTACGPLRYLDRVSGEAQRAVAEAKGAGAESGEPYFYHSAVQYLDMAREKAAYGDFELSLKYGERATRMARKAKDLTLERKNDKKSKRFHSPPDTHVRSQIPSRGFE